MASLDLLVAQQQRTGPYAEAKGDNYGNLCIAPPIDGIPKHAYLTTTGEGGDHNLNGIYATSTDAYYTVPEGRELFVYTALVAISDETKFTQVGYGGMSAGTVQNGITFWVKVHFNGNLAEVPLLGGFPIIFNYDWYSITKDITVSQFDLTPQTLSVEIDLNKRFGKPLRLKAGESFLVKLHDPFDGLLHHTFAIGGILF